MEFQYQTHHLLILIIKNERAKEIFLDLQSYILSNEGQKIITRKKGRRTWYGGVNSNVDKKYI